MRALFLALALSSCTACGHGSLAADSAGTSDFFLGCHWGGGEYQAFYDEE